MQFLPAIRPGSNIKCKTVMSARIWFGHTPFLLKFYFPLTQSGDPDGACSRRGGVCCLTGPIAAGWFSAGVCSPGQRGRRGLVHGHGGSEHGRPTKWDRHLYLWRETVNWATQDSLRTSDEHLRISMPSPLKIMKGYGDDRSKVINCDQTPKSILSDGGIHVPEMAIEFLV